MGLWEFLFGDDKRDPLKRGSRTPENKYKEFQIIDFNYAQDKEILSFKIQRILYNPKIVAYKTENYVKSPVYNGFSEKSKILISFSKRINLLNFINLEIQKIINKQTLLKNEPKGSLELGVSNEEIESIKFQIYEKMQVFPDEILKNIKIKKIQNKIKIEFENFKYYEKEKLKDHMPLKTDYSEKQGKFWLRLFFAFFTIGLSFKGYTSKKRAKLNIELNASNKIKNIKEEKRISIKNNEIQIQVNKNNEKVQNIILNLEEKLRNIQKKFVGPFQKELSSLEENNDFVNMIKFYEYKKADELKNKKGVYIIKNSTNGKVYVGQSKNLFKRIFQDHFNGVEVNNIKFAKDFYEGHTFFLKYEILKTKDELDTKEKEWIEYYDAFNSGYNKTGGNN